MQAIVVCREVDVPVEVVIGSKVVMNPCVGGEHHISQYFHPGRTLKGDLLRQVMSVNPPAYEIAVDIGRVVVHHVPCRDAGCHVNLIGQSDRPVRVHL